MPISPQRRLRRFAKGRESYEKFGAKHNLSMPVAIGLKTPSEVKKSLGEEDITEDNAFITRAQTGFKRDMMYNHREDKGHSRPGDSSHRAKLKMAINRMTGFKKKMLGKAYNTFDPTNQHKRMNPVVKSFANSHKTDYDTYTQNQMYNG